MSALLESQFPAVRVAHVDDADHAEREHWGDDRQLDHRRAARVRKQPAQTANAHATSLTMVVVVFGRLEPPQAASFALLIAMSPVPLNTRLFATNIEQSDTADPVPLSHNVSFGK